jgi:transcriptional regulator with XRE-family HTH domain
VLPLSACRTRPFIDHFTFPLSSLRGETPVRVIGGNRVTRGPTARRRQLGRALRKAREDAGLTQSAVARELGCGQGKVNKIETTLVAISMDELERLIALFGVPDDKAAELRELAIEDQIDGPRRTSTSPAWSAFEQLRDLEQDAREILCWHGERIPKPLQSEYYMLQQHGSDTKTTADVVRLVRQLEARAKIFTVDDPPFYRVILSESSFRRMPGGPSPRLVVDQVEHLLDLMSRYEKFTLQVLTFEASVRFTDTDFQIVHFAGDEPGFAYIEAAGGARTFDRDDELKMFDAHWHELRNAALNAADTKAFLKDLVNDSRLELKAEGNE